jgi:hypothetical protein
MWLTLFGLLVVTVAFCCVWFYIHAERRNEHGFPASRRYYRD